MGRSAKTILGLIFLLVVLPVTVLLALNVQNLTKQAAETKILSNPLAKISPTPAYVQGEVVVKFRSPIRVKAGSPMMKTPQKPMTLDNLETATVPDSLKRVNQKFPIKDLRQVFATPTSVSSNTLAPQTAGGGLENIYTVRVAPGIPIDQVLQEILLGGDAVYAEPNYILHATDIPNDPYYLDRTPPAAERSYLPPKPGGWDPAHDYQWNLKMIGMERAWDVPLANSVPVLVGVVDSGVDATHPELVGRVVPGYDFINDDEDATDDFGHGTHVAGIIAAISNNGYGMAGIAKNAKIIPIKVLDAHGSGTDTTVAAGIVYAKLKGAKIINASLGGIGYSQVLTDALTANYRDGVVFVVSAGNDNHDVASYTPANITCATAENPGIDCSLTIASVDQSDEKSVFSNWGTGIDLAAPGGDINNNVLSLKSNILDSSVAGLVVDDKFLRASGTSMAAPHIAGLAALAWSINPQLTNDQIRNILLNSSNDRGVSGFDVEFGYGRIDAAKMATEMNTTSLPVAKITSPKTNEYVGKIVTLTGYAHSDGFARYTVEYADSLSSSTWSSRGVTLTNGGTAPVYGDDLAQLDWSTLPEKPYVVRLRTETTDGRSEMMMVPLVLASLPSLHFDGVKNFPLSTDTSHAELYPSLVITSDKRINLALVTSVQISGVWQTSVSFAYSDNKGQSFTVVPIASVANDGSTPHLAIDGDRVYVAWDKLVSSTGKREIVLSVSEDRGQHFVRSTTVAIAQPQATLYLPEDFPESQPVVRDNTLGIFWKDAEGIHMVFSQDRGEKFGQPQLILPKPVYDLDVVMGTNNWYAVATKLPDTSAFIKGDLQGNFSVVSQDFNGSEAESNYARLGVTPSGKVYIAWFGRARGSDNLFLYLTSTDDEGKTFSQKILVDQNPTTMLNIFRKPSLQVIDDNRLLVAASKFLSGVYAYYSDTGGRTFTASIPLGGTIDQAANVFTKTDISVYGNDAWVVWDEDSANTGGKLTIVGNHATLPTVPPTPTPTTPPTFVIPPGTGSNPWNTRATLYKAKVGETLRIVNGDDAPHLLHVGRDAAPCPHQPLTVNGHLYMQKGEYYDCVLTKPYDSIISGPLGDHVYGDHPAFWIVVRQPVVVTAVPVTLPAVLFSTPTPTTFAAITSTFPTPTMRPVALTSTPTPLRLFPTSTSTPRLVSPTPPPPTGTVIFNPSLNRYQLLCRYPLFRRFLGNLCR